MLNFSLLPTIMTQLEVDQRTLADYAGIKKSGMSLVCSGQRRPSLDVALKIDGFLKREWMLRKGHTKSPELSPIVFNALYPDGGGDPFDGDKLRGRKAKTTIVIPPAAVIPPTWDGITPQDKLQTASALLSVPLTVSLARPDLDPMPALAAQNIPTVAIADDDDNVAPESKEKIGFHTPYAALRCWQDAVDSWKGLCLYYTVARKNVLFAEIRERFPEYGAQEPIVGDNGVARMEYKISDNALQKRLYRCSGAKQRKRKIDPTVTAWKEKIRLHVCDGIEWIRQHSPQQKGAEGPRAFGFNRSAIQSALAREDVVRLIANPATGQVPSLHYIESLFREVGWYLNNKEDVTTFVQRTMGCNPRFAGDIIQIDGTGIPISVLGAGKERKWKVLQGCDVWSGKVWMHYGFETCEQPLWRPMLKQLLLDDLQYGNFKLQADQVSGVFTQLAYLNQTDRDGKIRGLDTIMPEVLLALAMNVQPFLHTPEHAQAKGAVEVANKLLKHRELHCECVKDVLEAHARGELKRPRKAINHAEACNLMMRARANINKRTLSRNGGVLGVRSEVWMDPQDVAERAKRSLVANAKQIWQALVAKAKLITINGHKAAVRENGFDSYAELSGIDQCDRRPTDAVGIIFPQGLLAGDDPEQFRVLMIQQPQHAAGLCRFYQLTAKVAKLNRGRFIETRPNLGEGYQAIPDTGADELRRERIQRADNYAERVLARKTGTHDEPYREIEE